MGQYDQDTQNSANLSFIRESMAQPLLSRERELELALAWKERGDIAALHELVRAYGRLAVSMAARFRHYGLPLGDLIQEGNVGLMQAAARFEPERGIRFSTYAVWWIRASIQDYILRNWSIVRTGTTAAQKSLFFNLRRLRARIANRTGDHDLTDETRGQIASELGVPVADVVAMEQRMTSADQSLNATVSNEGEDEWQSLLADDRPNPEDVVIGLRDNATRTAWLNAALGRLNPRERAVIRERRLKDETVTLEALGHEMGVSKERVRQIEARAMNKLKSALLEIAGGES